MMEKKPFGVNLKRTGADPVRDTGFTAGSSVTSTSHTARKTSVIHTPLKPANVKDLKAMFDDKKGGGGTASSSGTSSPRSGAMSPRSGTTSPRSGSSSPGHTGLSTKKSESSTFTTARTVSSVSSSGGVKSSVLDNKSVSKVSSGLDRSQVGINVSKSSTTFTSSSVSSASSKRDNAFPSRINITATSAPSSKSESSLATGRAWSPKNRDATTADSKLSSQGLRSAGLKSADRKVESRVEIPVKHVTTHKKSSSVCDNKSKLAPLSTSSSSPSSSLPQKSTAKGTTTTVKTFQLVSGSSSESEKKRELFSSSLSSNKSSKGKDQNNSANSAGLRPVTREIPVQRISDSSKSEKSSVKSASDAASKQFTRGSNLKSSGDKKSESLVKPQNPNVSDSQMLGTRKLSSERFERIKFDFERGVPTESQERRRSETTDHIELQLKARDLQKAKVQAKPEEDKPKKEESIFDKGMKVSDFVKHINTVHPPSNQGEKPVKNFKVAGPKVQRSVSDPGGENEYVEMPEGVDDGIYEFVGDGTGNKHCVFEFAC